MSNLTMTKEDAYQIIRGKFTDDFSDPSLAQLLKKSFIEVQGSKREPNPHVTVILFDPASGHARFPFTGQDAREITPTEFEDEFNLTLNDV